MLYTFHNERTVDIIQFIMFVLFEQKRYNNMVRDFTEYDLFT